MNSPSKYFNGFAFQTLISSIPAVLVIAFFPLIGENLGMTVAGIGSLFLVARIGAILGGLLVQYLFAILPPHRLLIYAELANIVNSVLLLVAISYRSLILFLALAFFRGGYTGFVGVSRFSWLRQVTDVKWAGQVQIITLAIHQAAYAVAGLLFISSPTIFLATGIVIVDIVTSVFGAIIFSSLGKMGIGVSNAGKSAKENRFSLPFNSTQYQIFAADVFLAIALGGTNIMLVEYGEKLFGSSVGYGVALVCYSIFVVLGGIVISESERWATLKKYAHWLLVAALGLLFLDLPPIAAFFGLSIVFFSYSVSLHQVELQWFQLCSPSLAAKLFGFRTLVVSLIIALGEFGYPLISSLDLKLRLASSLFAAILLARFFKRAPNLEPAQAVG